MRNIAASTVILRNITLKKFRDVPLSRKLDYIGIIQLELGFLCASIREQLATMFRRKGFENSLRHWANRSGLMTY